jgi:hypothetical protein
MKRKRPVMPVFVFERRREIEVEQDLILAGELFVDFNRQSLGATIDRLLARARRGTLPEDGFIVGWRGQIASGRRCRRSGDRRVVGPDDSDHLANQPLLRRRPSAGSAASSARTWPDLPLSSRPSWPDPVLPKVHRWVEIVPLRRSPDPVHDAGAYSVPRRGFLDPPRRLNHELRSAALVDRLAQGAQ